MNSPASPSPRLTIAMVKAVLSPLSVTLSKRDGEYLVRLKGSPSGHGYFTNDLDDALATGKAMAARSPRTLALVHDHTPSALHAPATPNV